jgi:signal transduction histidine kinase
MSIKYIRDDINERNGIMNKAPGYPLKSFDLQEDSSIDLKSVPGGCNCGGKCLSDKVLYHTPVFTLVSGSTGQISLLNQAASEWLTTGSDSAIDLSAREILKFTVPEKWSEIDAILNEQRRWSGEVPVKRSNGALAILSLSIVRILDERIPGQFDDVYNWWDITERKKTEREICFKERLATRAEMAGEVSHELNNYLSIVMGNLELMSMKIESGQYDDLAARTKSVREGMARIAKFVEGLMSVQKPELKSEALELNQFLQSELSFFGFQEQFEGIQFNCEWGANIPLIYGDSCRLQQAVYNIMQNSADAFGRAQVKRKVIAVTTSYSAAEDLIKLTITDNGPGIGAEDYQRLFRQFYTTKGPGHGFGLIAVKGAVKSFGGKVSAAPGPSGGACFTIAIPNQKVLHYAGKQVMVPA